MSTLRYPDNPSSPASPTSPTSPYKKEFPDELDHVNALPQLTSDTVISEVEPTLHWRTWAVLFAGCFCWAGIAWVRSDMTFISGLC